MMVALVFLAMICTKNTPRLFLPVVLWGFLVALSVPSSAANGSKVYQTTVAGNVKVDFLYHLSNFKGPMKFGWVRVYPESQGNEIYVMTGPSVSIFTSSGMETFNFGFDSDLGSFYDATVDGYGNIITLSYVGWDFRVTKQNFRGEPIAQIALSKLPPELSGFAPARILAKDGNYYFADLAKMRVVVTDENGQYRNSFDLAAILKLSEEERKNSGLNNFNVDGEGNLLFTVPVLGGAYVVSPDRQFTKFGRRGSGPGKFGIPSDVISDGKGNYFVVDTLKCAVMVFDKNFRFLTEFGYRGPNPGNLIAPRSLSMDSKGRLYVTQSTRRGVSVFQIRYE